MMLTLEERVEVILICGRQGYTHRDVADEFNRRHPQREQIAQSTVTRLLQKFKKTGSVCDASRSGRPNTTTEKEEETILAKVYASPKKSVRRTTKELGLPRTKIQRVLKKHHFHPYKMQLLQKLNEDDPDRRLEMCEWLLQEHHQDTDFLSSIMFSDEANFYVKGEVNRHNLRYWCDENPHWFDDMKQQGGDRIMVWCGLWKDKIFGPYFFDGNVTSEIYLTMLRDSLIPDLDQFGSRPQWFMQDGAPPHYGLQVRRWLDEIFPQHWIGRRGPKEWAPRSPDLNPMDFAVWGCLKANVYSVTIRDKEHLRQRITAECNAFSPDVVRSILRNLATRLQLCYDNGGQHFEHIL